MRRNAVNMSNKESRPGLNAALLKPPKVGERKEAKKRKSVYPRAMYPQDSTSKAPQESC